MTNSMKFFALITALFVATSLNVWAADQPASKPKGKKLYHVVALKFKDTATREQIAQIETAFRDLKKQIKEIQSLEWGTNISPEKLDKGFTHGFVLTFKSEQARDAYLVHPAHKAFGKALGPVLADVFVIDFWAQP